MKKLFISAVFMLSATCLFAQSTFNEEVDAIQAIFGKEKKELIASLITLTPEESAKFWPVYDQYEVERKTLGKERVELMKQISDAYQAMTPEKADAVIKKNLEISMKSDKLLQKYHASVKKAVGSETAFEFYQAELYLLTEIRAAIMEEIPLYSEIKKLN
jgi:Spy/CpxP family protein refolding chaperone